MQFDVGAFKMAYEAEREWLLRIFPPNNTPPPEVAAAHRDVYSAGLRRGTSEAMQFDLGGRSVPPPEFDREYEVVWRDGYEMGSQMGMLRRNIVWTIVSGRFSVPRL